MRLSRASSTFLLLAAATLLATAGWYRASAQRVQTPPDVAGPARGVVKDAEAQAWLAPERPVPRVHGTRPGDLDFEGASDLYAYLQRLGPLEAAGDPRALWNASRIVDYCAGYAADPVAYAQDSRVIRELKGAATAAMGAARDRVGQRCRRFAPADGLSTEAVRARRVAAARGGSLAAEAALLTMGEPLSASDEYARDLVRRVRQSADPDAYLALSPAMGIAASGKEAYFGIVSGSPYAELAWQLAACRLGADCSAEGALMTSYCANGGICSRNRSQDFYAFVLDAAVPRQGADTLDEMVDSLLSDIGVPK